ncbi:MAG: fused DSP-PTPase phosphatase/NAD kinase-like protein [bacterium]
MPFVRLTRPSRLGPILLVGVLVFLGAWTARYNFRDNLVPRNFGVVDEGVLYRAGRLTPAQTKALVERHKIKTIIDLGAYRAGSTDERNAQRTAEALGVARFTFTLQGDGSGDPNDYAQALRIIAKPEFQPVLVHCAAGAQRTSACVVFYREIVQGRGIEESLPEALRYKHDPAKNPVLEPYIRQWHAAIAKAVREGGSIPWPITPQQ